MDVCYLGYSKQASKSTFILGILPDVFDSLVLVRFALQALTSSKFKVAIKTSFSLIPN